MLDFETVSQSRISGQQLGLSCVYTTQVPLLLGRSSPSILLRLLPLLHIGYMPTSGEKKYATCVHLLLVLFFFPCKNFIFCIVNISVYRKLKVIESFLLFFSPALWLWIARSWNMAFRIARKLRNVFSQFPFAVGSKSSDRHWHNRHGNWLLGLSRCYKRKQVPPLKCKLL